MSLDLTLLGVELERSKCKWMLALRLGDEDSAREHFQHFYENTFKAYEVCIKQLDRVQAEIKSSTQIFLIEDLVGFRYELRRLADQYGAYLNKLADFDGVKSLKLP